MGCSHAQYSIGDYKSATDAFRRGLEIDPSNAGLKTSLENAEARLESDKPEVTPVPRASPVGGAAAGGLGGLADALGGLGGLGGGGGGGSGMPDLASLMNNPMMMQMAQQMMANGGLERLMSNPTVANMVRKYGLDTMSSS